MKHCGQTSLIRGGDFEIADLPQSGEMQMCTTRVKRGYHDCYVVMNLGLALGPGHQIYTIY